MDYSGAEYVHIGWIIGPSSPSDTDSLPGAGNLLFDNGGWASYGSPHETSKTGEKSAQRDHSQVLEINPFTLDIIWQYSLNDFGNPFLPRHIFTASQAVPSACQTAIH